MQCIMPPEFIDKILGKLEECGYDAYLAGGCVRDIVMGREIHDWDIATSALPEEVEACFVCGKVLETGAKHGTVTVIAFGGVAEVTTFRVDGKYSDSRRPDSVKFVRTLSEDLKRRDFTINAMAMSRSGVITDLFGGRDDILKKLIRCVGDAETRFNEDALRILRALRFASKLGFKIEKKTAVAMLCCRGLLSAISAERIYAELCGALCGENAGSVFTEFADIFAVVIPEIKATFGFDQKTKYHCYDIWQHTVHAVEAAPDDLVLRLTMLFHDLGKPECFTRDANGVGHFYGHGKVSERIAFDIMTRLKSPAKMRDDVVYLVKYHDERLPEDEKTMRRFLAKHGEERARQIINVHRADSAAQTEVLRRERAAELKWVEHMLDEAVAAGRCVSIKDLAVGGGDLLKLGIPEGKGIGETLSFLLDHVLENPEDNTQKRLIEIAKNTGRV
ncbi:MAG: CCA tRNA nucleotidyltransferase [Oscillospiraceae bacterium]